MSKVANPLRRTHHTQVGSLGARTTFWLVHLAAIARSFFGWLGLLLGALEPHLNHERRLAHLDFEAPENTPAGVRSSSVIQEVGPRHEPTEDVRVSPAVQLLNSEPSQPLERLVRANHLGDELHTVDRIRMA